MRCNSCPVWRLDACKDLKPFDTDSSLELLEFDDRMNKKETNKCGEIKYLSCFS